MTQTEYLNSYKKYENKIYNFILGKIKDVEVSKDIVQETFTKLWVDKDKIDITKVSSWLFKTSYNDMINNIRYNKRFDYSIIIEDKEVDVKKTYEFDYKDILLNQIRQLNNKEKRLIVLRDVHNLSYKEISEKMDLTETQVKVYLFRVRTKLKDRLKKYL